MKKLQLSVLSTALFLAAAGTAHAGAVIVNGNVALGVETLGHLNTPASAPFPSRTGVAYNFGTATAPSWRDATSPGCLCEGWGVSANGTATGHANNDTGIAGLVSDSFSSTATTATSVVHLSALPGLQVTQAYAPSANTNALFVDNVTITNNTGATITDLKYVRVMDWDVPPTTFNEFVTIKGTGSTALLEESGHNGFNTPNPLAVYDNTYFGSMLDDCHDVDCTDNGPDDHGAYFRFNFGELLDGESYTFSIYYGAGANETEAIAAIAAEGIELYSLGQSNSGGSADGSAPTFIFGFKGVGGTALECGNPGQPPCPDTDPNPVPEPSVLAMLGLGLLGLGAARRRKA